MTWTTQNAVPAQPSVIAKAAQSATVTPTLFPLPRLVSPYFTEQSGRSGPSQVDGSPAAGLLGGPMPGTVGPLRREDSAMADKPSYLKLLNGISCAETRAYQYLSAWADV